MAGASVKLTSDPAYVHKCSMLVIFIDSESIFATIARDQVIFIDEGTIKLTCLSIAGAFITCKVDVGGILRSQKRVDLPDLKMSLPIISEYDKSILELAVKEKLDFVFCSFISNAECIIEIRKALGTEGENIKLVSKIESREGIRNLASIIDVSDGILIGRGALSTEVTQEKLFIAQFYIAAMCNKVGCPVIVTQELLESTKNQVLPTRAEVSDLANAVENGADVIMISNASIFSDRSNSIIQIASQVCKESEAALRRFPFDEWVNIKFMYKFVMLLNSNIEEQ